jgi:ferredoxin
VLEADGLVSLAKLKAHQLTRITGAVKNQFGCLPGLRKGEFHVRMNDIDRFSRMLVDLNRVVRARLFVVDGIVAMEGNGPRSGDPRPMNVLIFGDDPIAIDATICRLVGLDERLVATVVHGERTGLGSTDVRYVGDPLESFVDEAFDVNRAPGSTTGRLSGPFTFARNIIVPRPTIVAERCTLCGTCVEVCPVEPKAVAWPTAAGAAGKVPPEHTFSRCIRCYCCQEMCPSRAIEVERPPLRRAVDRLGGR